ncbi:MAG: hypothetical protein K0R62_3543 [Nonomuraea muscovyensis]|nr:hypothetical protein [Nonomuraea muscovyensis]
MESEGDVSSLVTSRDVEQTDVGEPFAGVVGDTHLHAEERGPDPRREVRRLHQPEAPEQAAVLVVQSVMDHGECGPDVVRAMGEFVEPAVSYAQSSRQLAQLPVRSCGKPGRSDPYSERQPAAQSGEVGCLTRLRRHPVASDDSLL